MLSYDLKRQFQFCIVRELKACLYHSADHRALASPMAVKNRLVLFLGRILYNATRSWFSLKLILCYSVFRLLMHGRFCNVSFNFFSATITNWLGRTSLSMGHWTINNRVNPVDHVIKEKNFRKWTPCHFVLRLHCTVVEWWGAHNNTAWDWFVLVCHFGFVRSTQVGTWFWANVLCAPQHIRVLFILWFLFIMPLPTVGEALSDAAICPSGHSSVHLSVFHAPS